MVDGCAQMRVGASALAHSVQKRTKIEYLSRNWFGIIPNILYRATRPYVCGIVETSLARP